MLIEIRCDRFRDRQIHFRSGLNAVLGDENATNSIGKSTLLMIVDFAFGGNALLEHNTDLIEELGHHDYFFTFDFGGELHRFRRGTFQSDTLYRCDEEFEPESTIDVDEYTAFLKQAYCINLGDLTFRALVGLYLRVWGKTNLDVHRPLHTVQNQPARECVTNLIKTFGRYAVIKSLSDEVAAAESKYQALSAAVKTRILPKIGKRGYAASEVKIADLQRQLNDIKANLAQYATSLAELVNRDVLDLKFQKDDLLALRVRLAARLKRTERNLAENRHIRSSHFASLVEFFPEVNQDRLAKVEEFHNGLARVLSDELRGSAAELKEEIKRLDAAIADIDVKMAGTLKSIDEPTQLVNKVYDIATALKSARDQNARFVEKTELRERLLKLKAELAEQKRHVLAEIEEALNAGMREIVTSVFGETRKSPVITLHENNYSFEVFEDTGTGTAYAGMIVFDLTVFRLTTLPVIAHDSVLFKNIENDSVARLLQIYAESEKQSFIALDEISKYGTRAAALLQEKNVIQLADDHVLYIRDWRARGA